MLQEEHLQLKKLTMLVIHLVRQLMHVPYLPITLFLHPIRRVPYLITLVDLFLHHPLQLRLLHHHLLLHPHYLNTRPFIPSNLKKLEKSNLKKEIY
jgi:hypothetical protein